MTEGGKIRLQNQIENILDLERISLGHVLTIGQSSLPEAQFQSFKKLVMDHFHTIHKPNLISLLKNSREYQVKETSNVKKAKTSR